MGRDGDLGEGRRGRKDGWDKAGNRVQALGSGWNQGKILQLLSSIATVLCPLEQISLTYIYLCLHFATCVIQHPLSIFFSHRTSVADNNCG